MASFTTPQSQVARSGSTPGTISSYMPSTLLKSRHTPHGARRLEPEDQPDVQDLLGKTWNVYQVTPMYDFRMTDAALKKYGKHLSAYLQAESQKGIGVDVTNDMVNRAVFSVRKNFKTSSDDSEAIELKVKGTNSTNGAVTLTALLCSVGADIRRKLDGSFVLLPVLMVKGPVGVTKLVIGWLQSQFDCHIVKTNFSFSNLAWTIALWAGMEDKGVKPLEMEFTVPKEIREGLDRITYKVQQQDAERLWQCIHDQDTNDITGEEVATFIKALEEHFYEHFKIHLEGLSLSALGTPLCYIGLEGKVKIFQEDGVKLLIQHLTEITTEKIFA